jgi:hypothetical protein
VIIGLIMVFVRWTRGVSITMLIFSCSMGAFLFFTWDWREASDARERAWKLLLINITCSILFGCCFSLEGWNLAVAGRELKGRGFIGLVYFRA